jgi:beta-phosphoglucomutase-like phosphatase (HAD superfamily)
MTEIITKYLKTNNFTNLDLRAVLFDMDGIIYNSMPAHKISWQQTISEWGLKAEPNEFFIQEGKPAVHTINMLFQRNLKRDATEQEVEDVYKRKSELFFENDSGELIAGIKETIKMVQDSGLIPILVTGSGQSGLYERLNGDLPNVFTPENMVTAFEVEIGKPHPEPYLMGLKKAGNLKPNQAFVLENAPLGVESGHRANILTVAVNTGPLDDKVLIDAGADLLLDSIEDFNIKLPELLDRARTIRV